MKTGQCQLCMICCEAEAANNGMSGLSGAWCEFPAHRVSACTFCPPCLYFFAHLPTLFVLVLVLPTLFLLFAHLPTVFVLFRPSSHDTHWRLACLLDKVTYLLSCLGTAKKSIKKYISKFQNQRISSQ